MNRRLMGSFATVGVTGIIASLLVGCDDAPTTTAYCVDKSDRIVEDRNCGGSTNGSSGYFFYGGQSYRYYYGGAGGTNGSKATGGSYTAPKDATVVTRSGSTVQRGGLGAKSAGSGS